MLSALGLDMPQVFSNIVTICAETEALLGADGRSGGRSA